MKTIPIQTALEEELPSNELIGLRVGTIGQALTVVECDDYRIEFDIIIDDEETAKALVSYILAYKMQDVRTFLAKLIK